MSTLVVTEIAKHISNKGMKLLRGCSSELSMRASFSAVTLDAGHSQASSRKGPCAGHAANH
ncbi:hypothetical protein D3C78_649870 [compost metagenome]